MAALYLKKMPLWQKIARTAVFGLFYGSLIVAGWTLLEQPKTIIVRADSPGTQTAQASGSKFFNFLYSRDPQDLDHPLNILILGRSGGEYIAPDLTDSIIIMHLAPKGKADLISVPRDLWVKVPDQNYYEKINALYPLDEKAGSDKEFNLIKEKITEVTGLSIDYYALVDVTMLRDLVDLLGGIDVYVANNIHDHVFQNLDLETGWHHLDGRTVQKYVRSRMDGGGDFARIKRQQQVIGILKQRIFGLSPIWDFGKLIEVYRTIGRNVKTDIGLSDMQKFFDLAELYKDKEFKQIVVGPPNLVRPSSAWTSGGLAYILVPTAGPTNYQEIKNFINNNLDSQQNYGQEQTPKTL